MAELISPDGTALDFCGSCKGMWFDAGEVADFAGLGRDLPDLVIALLQRKPTEFPCPVCEDESLVEIKYARFVNLLLDYCLECKGLYFDAGEVRSLQRVAVELKNPQSRLVQAMARIKPGH